MRIYFDRNVWGKLREMRDERGDADPMPRMQAAVADRKFEVVFSTTVLEETMALVNHSAETFVEELRLIFTLVKRNRVIKPADTLLREAVQSYAHNRKVPDMYTRVHPLLEKLLSTGKVTSEFRRWAQPLAELPNKFPHRMNPAFEKARDIGRQRGIGRPASIADLWNLHAAAIARWRCEHDGVEKQCLERGLEGLLNNRTVRLYTIYYAALVHSKWFGEQGKPGKVKPSESGDFFHSVQASAADVFVTEDARLVRWLTQIPVDGLEIMNFDDS